MSELYIDKFGFLPEPVKIKFSIGEILPVDDFEDIFKKVLESSYENRYLYPSLLIKRGAKYNYDYRDINTVKEWEDIPRTLRPSPIMYLPITHKIKVSGPSSSTGRYGIGGFLINLAAFLFGTRAQFHDWRVDGRTAIKRRSCFVSSKKTSELLFKSAIKVWNRNPENFKIRLTNILYLYLKALSEEYDWIEFTLMYMVFDSCYKLSNDYYGKLNSKTHLDRLHLMANRFGLYENCEEFILWSKIRNTLFHEAIWCGRTPGSSTKSDKYLHFLYFQGFVCRIIVSMLEYSGSFVSSTWKSAGLYHL